MDFQVLVHLSFYFTYKVDHFYLTLSYIFLCLQLIPNLSFTIQFYYKQAQMCAEGCEGSFLYSLISIRETAFQLKDV